MPTFDYTISQAFLRDTFVPFREANVSIASSPVLYGLSIYTVFSVNWNATTKKLYIFRLRDHYDRLVNSAKIMDFHNFATAWSYEKFEATMLELIHRNAASNPIQEDVLVRATVFVDELIAGTKIHGLKHALTAYVYPMGAILSRDGVNLCVSSWTRNPDNAIPSRAKVNGSYANASLIKNEALLNGYDDAIVLDSAGHVTEGTVANIFLVRKNASGNKPNAINAASDNNFNSATLVTPSASSDLLEGITRASVIRMATDLGMRIEERAIDRSELYIADEAFLCGSSARITPILSVDRRPIGSAMVAGNNPTAGPITTAFSKKYNEIQTGNAGDDYKEWLTEIA